MKRLARYENRHHKAHEKQTERHEETIVLEGMYTFMHFSVVSNHPSLCIAALGAAMSPVCKVQQLMNHQSVSARATLALLPLSEAPPLLSTSESITPCP